MRAGDLDQRVVLLVPSKSRDSFGQMVSTYSPLRTVWAGVLEGMGKDFIAGADLTEQSRAAFKLRFVADIERFGTTLRVAWRGQLYEITQMTGSRHKGELWLHGKTIGAYP